MTNIEIFKTFDNVSEDLGVSISSEINNNNNANKDVSTSKDVEKYDYSDLEESFDEEKSEAKSIIKNKKIKNTDSQSIASEMQVPVIHESVKSKKKRKKKELEMMCISVKPEMPTNLSLASGERDWLFSIDNSEEISQVHSVFETFVNLCDKDKKQGVMKLAKIRKLFASAKSNRSSVVEDKSKKIAITFIKRHFLMNKNKR